MSARQEALVVFRRLHRGAQLTFDYDSEAHMLLVGWNAVAVDEVGAMSVRMNRHPGVDELDCRLFVFLVQNPWSVMFDDEGLGALSRLTLQELAESGLFKGCLEEFRWQFPAIVERLRCARAAYIDELGLRYDPRIYLDVCEDDGVKEMALRMAVSCWGRCGHDSFAPEVVFLEADPEVRQAALELCLEAGLVYSDIVVRGFYISSYDEWSLGEYRRGRGIVPPIYDVLVAFFDQGWAAAAKLLEVGGDVW